MTTITVKLIVKKNTRFASIKGQYNCEALQNGKSFICDGQGDTAEEAKRICRANLNKIAAGKYRIVEK